MVELTRKQREIELRTAEILRVSKPILVQEGFHALSMDRVAAQMEYAKGTIYNHFPHKEEIVLALAVESINLRRKLFEHASTYSERPRLCMMALGTACEFYSQKCSDDFVIEQWVRNTNIWEKSSERRQNLVRECEGDCMKVVSSIVRRAINHGDLLIPNEMTPEEFVFGYWAISFGSQILTYSSPSLAAIGIHNPFRAIRTHCCTLMNGFQWQPIMELPEYMEHVESICSKLEPIYQSMKAKHTGTN